MNFVNTGMDERTADEALKKSTGDKPDKRVIVLRGTPEHLDVVEQMLGYIAHLGAAGHSTDFTVGVDGDGWGRIKAEREKDGKDLFKIHADAIKEQSDPNGDVKRFDLV